MSGSGGGGYVPPQRAKFDCDNGQVITTLSSVDLIVLKKLAVGVILEVEIGGNESLVVIDADGEIVGSIVHPSTSDIIECIKKGNHYEAEIVEINYPACKVKIKSIK
ncbi:hypothetical protein EZL74_07020 [Flavobacterium silvisoli]|uniref:Uncharacterized protein n=1 Tax=Flavobacterium silvisoli TaxID=2529433 RepID=A0A4Q9Z0T1_9FLAO|nr:hypothetical protein [Flavobacterium silvisoli]TBX69622.1 hypothetical protein EZL74_07020 [Flavobacterium silvisoli]